MVGKRIRIRTIGTIRTIRTIGTFGTFGTIGTIKESIRKSAMKSALAVVVVGVLMGCGACTKKIYVPLENREVVRDSIREYRMQKDTIMTRDSVLVYQHGDTLERTIVRERIRIAYQTDTMLVQQRDTIYLQTPVALSEKETESEGSRNLWILLLVSIPVVIIGIRKLRKLT